MRRKAIDKGFSDAVGATLIEQSLARAACLRADVLEDPATEPAGPENWYAELRERAGRRAVAFLGARLL